MLVINQRTNDATVFFDNTKFGRILNEKEIIFILKSVREGKNGFKRSTPYTKHQPFMLHINARVSLKIQFAQSES